MSQKSNRKRNLGDQPNVLRVPDARITATQLAEPFHSPWTDHTYPTGAWVTVSDSVKAIDGNGVIGFQPPQVVSFNLLESNAHCLKAERLRTQVLAHVKSLSDGSIRPTNSSAVLDVMSEAASGLFFAFSAIEGLANVSVDELPETTTVTVQRKGLMIVYEKESLIRRLSVAEKLDKVVPLVTGKPSIKGSKDWQKLVELRRLRDSLVHIRPPERPPNPDKPSAYGRILRGDAKKCTLDAMNIIESIRPEWVEPWVHNAITEGRKLATRKIQR